MLNVVTQSKNKRLSINNQFQINQKNEKINLIVHVIICFGNILTIISKQNT